MESITPVGRSRSRIGGALLAMALGATIAVLPHLLWWPRIGSPYWVADNDDLLYASIAGQAYLEHPTYLTDPTQTTPKPTFYPPIQFVPGIVVARALQLGPLGVDVVWRTWAGASITLGFFLVIGRFTRRAFVPTVLAVLLAADAGVMDSRPIVQSMRYLAQLGLGRTGHLFATYPEIFKQYRIITPGLSLLAILLHAWLLLRARERPTRARTALAGASFGLLFWVYFYYWTGAALALVMGALADHGRRRVYVHTLAIGGVIGLPAVLEAASFRARSSPDWLPRADLFLPIDRFSGLLIHKEALVLLVVTGLWVWRVRRDLFPLWSLALSGWLLANHAILTRLQIQNDHWSFVRAPFLTLLLTCLVLVPLAERLALQRRGRVGLVIATVLLAALGVGLRTAEGFRTRESVENQEGLLAYLAQRPPGKVPPLVPNSVLAGAQRFVDLACILEDQRPLNHYAIILSPYVDNAEWNERIALDSYLRGEDRASFARRQRTLLEREAWGPWSRSRTLRERRLADLDACFARIEADPHPALDRFHVRYLALPAGAKPESNEVWRPVQDGSSWSIWERVASPENEALRFATSPP